MSPAGKCTNLGTNSISFLLGLFCMKFITGVLTSIGAFLLRNDVIDFDEA
jgi:hypothetical protein